MIDIFLAFVIKFLQIVIQLLQYALFFHIILSWFAQGRSKFGGYLEQIVQPMLAPFRWARIGMFDLSVIIVYLLLGYGGNILLKFLATFLSH